MTTPEGEQQQAPSILDSYEGPTDADSVADMLAGLDDDAFARMTSSAVPDEPERDVSQPATEASDEEEARADEVENTEEGEEEEDADKADDDTEAKEPEDEAEGEEDYVEIGEGDDLERIPLSTLIQSHQQITQMTGDITTFKDQLATQFHEKMTPIMTEQLEKREAYVALYEEMLAFNPVGAAPSIDDFEHTEDFVRAKEAHAQRLEAFESAKAQLQEHKDEIARDKAQAAEQARNVELSRLAAAWPEMSDPVEGPKLRERLLSGAEKHFGIKPEDLNGVTDHREYLVLRVAVEAMEARENAPARSEAVKKKVAAKLVKSKRAAPTSQTNRAAAARKKAMKTGSVEDAAAYLLTTGIV